MELNYSKRELAEIWNTLNTWKWDDRLGEKPDNWDSLPDFNFTENHKNPTKRDYIKPYTTYIMNKIGEKECLRCHHINHLGKSNLQYKIWGLKQKLYKLFKVGFYSSKMQKELKMILNEIKQKNQEDWNKENYNK